MMYMIERTKVMDHIYLKYKIRVVELMQATQEYSLDEDPDIKTLRAANQAQRSNIALQKKNNSQLSPG